MEEKKEISNIALHCDSIYRKYDKIKHVLEVEAAEKQALLDHFGKAGPQVYEIELEKSGRIRTLGKRIIDRVNLIHTKYHRMIEELGVVDMFKTFTAEDLDAESFSKLKTAKAQQAAIEKLPAQAKKDFESKLLEILIDKSLVSEITRVIGDVYAIAEKRKITPVDLGNINKKAASKFIV